MEEQNQETPENQKKTEKPEKENTYPSASLYVGDLHPDVTEAFLYEIFKEAGSIVSIRVCRDTFTRESLGYAYVNFGIPQDAERALQSLNYTVINDKPIRIMWAHKDPTLRKTGIGNVFIKGLDAGIDNKCLYDTFSAFGVILSSKVQHTPGRKTGVGYVHFNTFEAAQRSIDKVDGKQINGRIVTVEHYKRGNKSGVDDSNFTNVYIRNLSKDVDDEKLAEILAPFGGIQNATVVISKAGEAKGVAFCNFDNHESANACVEALNDIEENAQEGKKLMACRSMKKSERMRYLREKFAKEGPPLYKNPGTNVYVKHLDESVDDEKLREMFAEFGTITSAVVMRDEKTEISKCFGFVNFSKSEEATRAINQMSEKRFGTKPIYVALAQPKEVRRQQMLNRFSKFGRGGFQGRQNFRGHRGGFHRNFPHNNRGGFYRGRRGGGFSRGRRHYHNRGGMNQRMVGMPPHEQGSPIFYPPQGFPQGGMDERGRGGFPQGVPQNPQWVQHNFRGQNPQDHPQHPQHPQHHPQHPQHPQQHQNRGFKMSHQARNFNAEEYDKQQKQQMGGQPMREGFPGPQQGMPRPEQQQMPGPEFMQRGQPPMGQPMGGRPVPAQQMPGPGPQQVGPTPPVQQQGPPVQQGNVPPPQQGGRPQIPTPSALAQLNKKDQKHMLGEHLFPLVYQSCQNQDEAGKITGMLLEMDNTDLIHLLETPEALRGKISEASELLHAHETQAQN